MLARYLIWCCCCVYAGCSSNYAIIATSKSASLVLAAVLCLLVFGDVVKAEEVFRRARVRDREVRLGHGW